MPTNDQLRCEIIQPSTERWPWFKRCENLGIVFVRPPAAFEIDDLWVCGNCRDKAVADGAHEISPTGKVVGA